MKRLPPIAGEWINRERPVRFRFEGREFEGYEGDCITSALLASGQRLLGRSFKYHRGRGVLSLANHDINVMMQSATDPNLRADITPLTAGLDLRAVNTSGGLTWDRRQIMQLLAPLLPVGFYYKAFHGRRMFPFWERRIRHAAGLGVVNPRDERVRTAKGYDWCDVLVVGGGVSGLHAALAAADAGADVLLVDENARLGGSGLFNLGGEVAQQLQVVELASLVTAHPRIRIRTQTFAAGYYADHWIPLVQHDRIVKLRARAVIFATGAYEQPAVFGNNDLPGVMLASAAQRLVYRYAVAPGARAVVLAANTDGYRAAVDMHSQGIDVALIVDLRPHGEPSNLQHTVTRLGISVLKGHGIYEARGFTHLKRVVIAPIVETTAAGIQLDPTRGQRVECDFLLMSVGWAPALSLLHQAGMRARFDDALSQFVPAELPAGIYACGRANGIFDLELKQQDGHRAGALAAAELGFSDPDRPKIENAARVAAFELVEPSMPSHAYPIFQHARGRNFVDFDEDLRLDDFVHAAQEGFDSIELLKRYTTVGMGPSQGKHSNMNALRILARIRGESPGQVGSTTARPFQHPVPLAHLAGRGFHAERETSLHLEHVARGARFMTAGNWKRPEYYAGNGEEISRAQALREEVAAVRERAGLIDVGTLGKIEVRGPDAALFLERVYTGRFLKQRAGTIRYGLMLDESGVIIDDGVVARLADDHFYFTTTTSGSATVYRELQRLNTQWRLRVGIVNLTGHYGAVNLAGPRAREVLSELTRLPLSEAAFPYLAAREAVVADIACRVLRVGFVGECGYEIHAPSDEIHTIWNALLQAGSAFGVRPFGVEAQRVLRLEKGHFIIGQDTDGLTNPYEASCAWALAMDKPFFIGQRSLKLLGDQPLRQKLVGFKLGYPGATPPKECHLVIEQGEIAGRVTSVAWSAASSSVIGLAMLTHIHAKKFQIRIDDGTLIDAVVTPTPFYDADNSRQKLAEIAA